METGLTTTGQSIALSPADVVAGATIQAKLLMDIVDKTKCFQEISGKKYLQVEAWETIGAFNQVHASTESVTPIIRDGETVGYDAKVNLINKNGNTVGTAIMPCYFTENACKGKEGDSKDKAAKSAAQTFATSKAYRMNYSYIAILAGYEPCPAEEMTGHAADDKPANLEHWCEEHKTKWFKKGKMTSYAHPIGDTKEWCHEPTKTGPPVVKPTVAQEVKDLYGPDAKPPAKPAPALINQNPAAPATASAVTVTSGTVNPCVAPEDILFSDDDYSGVAALLLTRGVLHATDVLDYVKKQDKTFTGFKVAQEMWDMAQKMPEFKK